jgi:Aldehyde dehydrogenase family/Ketopantoate reductase PanE/ApbA C terminal
MTPQAGGTWFPPGAGAVVGHKMSMLQDLERGRSLEIDALVTAVQELGQLAGSPTPVVSAVLALIQERGRAAGLYAPMGVGEFRPLKGWTWPSPINPSTGETVKTISPATDAEIDAALARAHDRFVDYRRTSFAQRAGWARRTADLLEVEAEQVAALMTLEMGKTLASAKAEALKCAKGFWYYAEHAEAMPADEPADAAAVGASKAFARYQPMGVVLAVMPWNFPLWQVARFAAPVLMAGNVGILKHASNVPQCALYLADVIERGGFPAVFRRCSSRQVRWRQSCAILG